MQIERDIRTLELLKLRFEGERTMAQCEVMLKDVGDSKRLAAAMQGVERAQGMAQDEWFSSLVISHLYWPSVSKVGSERLSSLVISHPYWPPLSRCDLGWHRRSPLAPFLRGGGRHRPFWVPRKLCRTASILWGAKQDATVLQEDIAVPAPVDGAMTRYAQKYSTLKMPRKVKWMKHLGSVTLGESAETRRQSMDAP